MKIEGANPNIFILTEDKLDSFFEGNYVGHIYLTDYYFLISNKKVVL